MKLSTSVLALWLIILTSLTAQDSPPGGAPNPNATVITADVFRLYLSKEKRQGIFSSNVQVAAKDFKMKSDEMTVFFAEGSDGKVEKILARGHVEIIQTDRTSKSNQAEYSVAEDKMVLTGNPEIFLKNGNHISGSTITIYRSTSHMEVDGQSRMELTDFATPSAASTK